MRFIMYSDVICLLLIVCFTPAGKTHLMIRLEDSRHVDRPSYQLALFTPQGCKLLLPLEHGQKFDDWSIHNNEEGLLLAPGNFC